MTYPLLKFLHIAGASGWVGGLVTITVLDARLSQAPAAALGGIVRLSEQLRRVVLGPSAALTLIAGGAAMAVSGVGFDLWIVWGLAAIVASIVIGAFAGRRWVLRLSALARTAGPRDPDFAALRRRVVMIDALLVVLMLSTIAVMVFKPA